MKRYKLIFAIIILAMFICLGYVIKRRAFEYGYNASADYLYGFDTTYAKIISATIKDGLIEFPQFDANYNTSLLEVQLKSNVFGYFVQPEIQLQNDTINASQYFENGVNGIRYLNISDFIRNKSCRIQLDGHRCSISTNNCKLILYKNKDVKTENVLVLSPHPDDAEIAAFGLYSCNKNSFIVTITAGDAGKNRYEDFYSNDHDHYLKKGELRVWNSLTVPLLAGLNPQNIINLGYFDSMLKSMYMNDTLITQSRYIGTSDIKLFRSKNISSFLDSLKASSTWRSLVNDLKYILKKRKPTIIVTPYPAIDFHFDHKLTTVALLQAMKELHYTGAELWMYTNHYSKPDYYPIGAMGSLTTLPPHFGNPTVYFNKIYLHSLSKNMQIDKLFALDAMNDLRYNTEWHSIGDLCKVLIEKITNKLYNEETDYYCRSVRSSEIFFVVNAKDIFDDLSYKSIIGSDTEKNKSIK